MVALVAECFPILRSLCMTRELTRGAIDVYNDAMSNPSNSLRLTRLRVFELNPVNRVWDKHESWLVNLLGHTEGQLTIASSTQRVLRFPQ